MKEKNNKMVFLYKTTLFFVIFINIVPAFGITGKTKRTIIGSAPTYKDINASKKLGFKFDNNFINKLNNDGVIQFSEPLRTLFPQVVVEDLIKDEDYIIQDGDGDDDENSVLNVTDYALAIVDSMGKPIDLDALDDSTTICNLSGYSAPYIMQLNATFIPVTSYGDPFTGEPIRISQEYNLDVNASCASTKILYLRPKDSITSYGPLTNGFELNKGFSPDARSLNGDRSFPSVGFLYAQFYVDVEGDVNNYVFSIVDPESNVELKEFEVTKNKIRFIQPFLGKARIVVKKVESNSVVVVQHDFEIRDWFKRPADIANTYCAYKPSRGTRCVDICEQEPSPFSDYLYDLPQPWYLTSASAGTDSGVERRIATLLGEWGNISDYDYTGNDNNTFGGSSYIPGSYITRTYVSGSTTSMVTVSSGSGRRFNVPVASSISPVICWIGPKGESSNRPAISY